MTWVIYAFVSIVTSSFIGILQRVLMKDEDSDPISYAIALQFLGALFAFGSAFIRGFKMPPIGEHPFNFILLAILYSSATLLSFKALKLIEASRVAIVFSFSAVIAILGSSIFLQEILTPIRLLGAAIIILSIILVLKHKDFSINKGMFYALLAAILWGLAAINDGYLLRFSEPISYTAIAFLFPGILLSLSYPKSIKKLNVFLKTRPLRNMLLLSFMWAISAIAFYLAIEKGALISQISPIFQSRIIVTVLLAAVLLKERDNLPIKIGAAFLTMFGVMMIK